MPQNFPSLHHMDSVLKNVEKVERVLSRRRIGRFLWAPFKYLFGHAYLRLIYPLQKGEKPVRVPVITGQKMHLLLPAAMDIFLFGCKTHPSEMRLTKFLTKHLQPGHTFYDIGAHVGFYSMLAAHCVGEKGHVFAFEGSERSFHVLSKNSRTANFTPVNKVVTEKTGRITFFQFPLLYSEYNSSVASENEGAPKPEEVEVESIALDHFTQNHPAPDVIKMDVEGGEAAVIGGMKSLLQQHNPMIIMEFEPFKKEILAIHLKATEILENAGYQAHIIDRDGELKPHNDLRTAVLRRRKGSDNVVFIRPDKI